MILKMPGLMYLIRQISVRVFRRKVKIKKYKRLRKTNKLNRIVKKKIKKNKNNKNYN